MTLIIATTTPDGVVLTADSRQTYVNRSGLPRIASDNATKIIQLTETAVVATAGTAFFIDGGKQKSIQAYLHEFRDSGVLEDLDTTEAVASALDAYCRGWIERIMKASIVEIVAAEKGIDLVFEPIVDGKLPYRYKDAGGQEQRKEWFLTPVSFIVAGRDPDGSCHAINVLPFGPPGVHSTSDTPNLQWIGQAEVINKLFGGQDYFILSLATMTIQDAVDFSILLTRTTENIQKFSDGIAGSQGGIPGVGGPIDVVWIPRKGPMKWLSQKTLNTEGARL